MFISADQWEVGTRIECFPIPRRKRVQWVKVGPSRWQCSDGRTGNWNTVTRDNIRSVYDSGVTMSKRGRPPLPSTPNIKPRRGADLHGTHEYVTLTALADYYGISRFQMKRRLERWGIPYERNVLGSSIAIRREIALDLAKYAGTANKG